jgi:hypothetical protein
MWRAAMGKVVSEVSMSLDGFITGPNVRVGNGMGDDGDRLHDWRFDAKTEIDTAIVLVETHEEPNPTNPCPPVPISGRYARIYATGVGRAARDDMGGRT